MNPLVQLSKLKQSYWLDYIRRDLLTSGELKRMIEEEGLRGMTSNPTIFQKALESSQQYDQSLKKYSKKFKSEEDIFEAIAIEDIQQACDIFASVFKSANGKDGFVSLEVNPQLAYDTKATLASAQRLWKKVNRPNVMIKIPGTKEGLPAVEEATYLGINVNITLLFSVEVYKQVVEAYFKGLERRLRDGKPITNINSVASFFVSRVDSILDKQLDALIEQGGPDATLASELLHKAAVNNAKLAYEYYSEAIGTPRFLKLQQKGANVQRLLWASTSSKDKRIHDIYYVEELIGPDTVNTMPPPTAEAFRDHGLVKETLTKDWDKAKKEILALARLGIRLDELTKKLEEDGVRAFIQSYRDLLGVVCNKRELLTGTLAKTVQLRLINHQSVFENGLAPLKKGGWLKRIWSKDATFWKQEEAHQKIIQNSLGWLTVTDKVQENLKGLDRLVGDVRKAKFANILLLGMGGSSLCPEVLRLTFGKKSGYPDFAILDSTDPASILEKTKRAKPKDTLYIVASKSGSTIEPNAFFSYFYEEVKKKKGNRAGENFIAITDPGTQMEALAKEKKFRHIILNPPDIGGRYSALSFFGMVPAALMGIPAKELIDRANRMAAACSAMIPAERNPGALLGVSLGELAKAGRNKVTFFIAKEIESFGTWVEQLIAESTGKEGVGILPVESESIQDPEKYGSDRLFVSIQLEKGNTALDQKLKKLEKAHFPVIRVIIKDKFDIAAQFFLWEMATAIAGKCLGINPFDQPNVQEAKELAKHVISEYKTKGDLPKESPMYEDDLVQVFGKNGGSHPVKLEEALQGFLTNLREKDYVALLAYLTREKKNEELLQDIRHQILKSKKVATTLGFGPRYLHSTGQLHKGGDGHGVFISITAEDQQDVSIPGKGYSFHILKEAQARGDTNALREKDRRVLHIHLKDSKKGLLKLKESFKKISPN